VEIEIRRRDPGLLEEIVGFREQEQDPEPRLDGGHIAVSSARLLEPGGALAHGVAGQMAWAQDVGQWWVHDGERWRADLVLQDRTVELVRAEQTGYAEDSACGYGPTDTDTCNRPGQWHLKVVRPDGAVEHYLACGLHDGAARLMGRCLDFHEAGSACGVVQSWWVDGENGSGSRCATTEAGIAEGWLSYLETDDPRATYVQRDGRWVENGPMARRTRRLASLAELLDWWEEYREADDDGIPVALVQRLDRMHLAWRGK
jgi:hypothetical protein